MKIELRLGHLGDSRPVLRDGSRMKRFFARGPNGDRPIIGLDGHDPAGYLREPRDGTYVLGYLSAPVQIELASRPFEAYLETEGLEAIVAERLRLGEEVRPGRERYVRCAKAILTVGDHPADVDQRLGLPFEIVPLQDPRTAGESLVPLRVLYQGKPCSGVLVRALHRGLRSPPLSARTNQRGEVRLNLNRDGFWLLKAVHMVRASAEGPFEWESYWASLTFRRGTAEEDSAGSNRTSPDTRPAAGEPSESSRQVRDWVNSLRR